MNDIDATTDTGSNRMNVWKQGKRHLRLRNKWTLDSDRASSSVPHHRQGLTRGVKKGSVRRGEGGGGEE